VKKTSIKFFSEWSFQKTNLKLLQRNKYLILHLRGIKTMVKNDMADCSERN